MNSTLVELCRRALLALDEDDFPLLREDLRNALKEVEMLYVARITKHDTGSFAYIFRAAGPEDAQQEGERLLSVTGADTLDELLPAEEYVGSEVIELCAF